MVVKIIGVIENKRFNLDSSFSMTGEIHPNKEKYSLKVYNDTMVLSRCLTHFSLNKFSCIIQYDSSGLSLVTSIQSSSVLPCFKVQAMNQPQELRERILF